MNEPVYVDSNVFVLPLLGETATGGRSKAARRVLDEIEEGRMVAYTSVMTWDEVVWAVSRAIGREDGVAAEKKLLRFPGLRFLEATLAVTARAEGLMETTDLRPRDALHCASALAKGLETFVSDDHHFAKAPGIRHVDLERIGAIIGAPDRSGGRGRAANEKNPETPPP